MKKTKTLLGCVANQIKNFFFKAQKNDISHACEELFDKHEETTPEELKYFEEYAIKYATTTRWQTV